MSFILFAGLLFLQYRLYKKQVKLENEYEKLKQEHQDIKTKYFIMETKMTDRDFIRCLHN